MTDLTKTRGYRNKNPGNLDYVPSNKWQGQVGLGDRWLPEGDRRFAEFVRHEYGIRALAMLLTTYQDRHGLRTVRGIVNRWAPPKENDTGAYVLAVSQALGVGPDDVISLHDYDMLRPMVEAIIRHELGGMPYDDRTLEEGLKLAGVPRPVTSVRVAAATEPGQSAITVGAAATAAATAAPAIQAMAGLPQWVGVALVLGVALTMIVIILNKQRWKSVPRGDQ